MFIFGSGIITKTMTKISSMARIIEKMNSSKRTPMDSQYMNSKSKGKSTDPTPLPAALHPFYASLSLKSTIVSYRRTPVSTQLFFRRPFVNLIAPSPCVASASSIHLKLDARVMPAHANKLW